MYEYNNNQIESQDTNFRSDTLNKTTKLYIFYTLIAGILTLIPVSSLILRLVNSNISEYIYIILFYVEKVIGFLIYFFLLKKITKKKIILIIIAGIFLLFSGLMYNNMNSMENTGIDYIGQALGMAIIFKICLYIYYIIAFILFISYAKNFILKKKVIIPIIISIVAIVLLVFAYKTISQYTSIQKVTEDIKTVSDFKNELNKRDLYAEEYLLFGVDNKENNIHKISFDTDLNKKYLSYIYYGYKTKNVSKNINKNDDYLYWIIYYTNGKIYATLVDYYESSYPNSYNIYSNVLGEEEELYTYNWDENYYEKINIEKDGISTETLYYHGNDMYISIEALSKSSFGYVEYLCEKYEVIDEINSYILDNYANNLKEKN